ncbi:MAG TPA: cysteine desulfurase [Fimbriimonadales bacterium]|nr:cysteine desulfurase [Fimbriimonadales bacterium]
MTPISTENKRKIDVEKIRKDFPALHTSVEGRPLVYLDNAATSQKPLSVIEATREYYINQNANVHRGVHYLSRIATTLFEETREKAHRFLNSRSPNEIIFTKGCTEAINLVAYSYGRAFLKPGDEILLTNMEHHSNIVPWQLVAEATGAKIRVIPINDCGELLLDEFEKMLSERTKIVGCVYISNVLGTINPIKEITKKAHEVGAVVLVDGAQSTPHLRVDVQDLDVDFYTVSGHKMYAPTGVGVLYGKLDLLEKMIPYQGGGDMIRTVSFEKTTYKEPPHKFEAGTPNIAGVVAMGSAIDYIENLGMDAIQAYENELSIYAHERIAEVPGIRVIGTAKEKAGLVSFVMDCAHAHDIGTILDSEGIAVRAGHHCCMPLMERFGISATARASLAFYNTKEEIDILIKGLYKVREIFK